MINESTAISYRNSMWENKREIPKWIDVKDVCLDQFFTKNEISKYCYNDLQKYLLEKKEENLFYIEPSAGNGEFLNLLPQSESVGIDVCPMRSDIIRHDFLSWSPEEALLNKKKVFIGNPPFGYRAWLALAFVNHAAKFADYIGFILPMAFQSEGKGSPKHRVKGMRLVKSEVLPQDSFYNPDGKERKVNSLWQIWEKGENIIEKKKTCRNWIEIFTVDQRKERLCGQSKMQKADYFLQRTYYKEKPSLVKDFSEVKYVCGYGIIIKKDRQKILNILNNVDWDKYNNLAAHNCKHISMYHIEQAITDKGLYDV